MWEKRAGNVRNDTKWTEKTVWVVARCSSGIYVLRMVMNRDKITGDKIEGEGGCILWFVTTHSSGIRAAGPNCDWRFLLRSNEPFFEKIPGLTWIAPVRSSVVRKDTFLVQPRLEHVSKASKSTIKDPLKQKCLFDDCRFFLFVKIIKINKFSVPKLLKKT